jgi:Glycosyl transferase family 2
VPTSSRPLLSVVVVAHERRAFVGEALRSIELQTLPRDRFEVFLLKDFEAPEIQAQVDRLGATVVEMTPGPLGKWIADVSGRLRGEIIAFLDDDDAFEPEKLEGTVERFRTNETAVYLHHGTRPLDGHDRADSSGAVDRRPRGPNELLVIPPAEWRRSFRDVWRRGAAFNLSSIVVRRQVVEAFPDALAQVRLSLSVFLFYAALRLDGTVLLDGRALVRYRREEGFGPRGAPAPRSARRLSDLARPRGEDAKLLLHLVSPLQLPACEAPLRAAEAEAGLVIALEGGGARRRNVLSGLFSSVRDRPWGALMAERVLFRDALLLLIAPRRAHRAWERHRGRAPVETHPG